MITARNSNRLGETLSVLTALSLEIGGIMLVWGDRYGEEERVKNVYDFSSLSDLVAHARGLAERAGVKCRILASVGLGKLRKGNGEELARLRLEKGVDLLLAQPPGGHRRGAEKPQQDASKAGAQEVGDSQRIPLQGRGRH